MTDTVAWLLSLADEYANTKEWSSHANAEIKRQSLQEELTWLFTPLSDEQVVAGFRQQHYKVECSNSFEAGIRWAEQQHGIGGES